MAKILDKHDCDKQPDNIAIVNSGANGWLIASRDGNLLETKVLGIFNCPYCGERLEKA